MKNLTKILLCSIVLMALSLSAFAQPDPCHISSGTYCSFTQGGWGQNSCNGGNVACRRNTWFDLVYPGSLVVGGTFTITFDSSENVGNLLPTGSTPAALNQNYVNPTSVSPGGSFVGQVVSLRLNRDFAAFGAFGANHDIGHLVKPTAPLQGWTVNQILALAEAVLGGNTSLLAPNGLASVSALSTICDNINNVFDNCVNNGSLVDYLVEPGCYYGRCCYGDPFAPQCQSPITEAACAELHGSWLGNQTCESSPCHPQQHTGRCCYGDPYAPQCAVNTQEECDALHGSWAMSETCITSPCVPQVHTGRCCYGDPFAPQCAVTTEQECAALHGSWLIGETCDTSPCHPEHHTGRCCYGDPYAPQCAVNTQEECDALHGVWAMSETCITSPCVPQQHFGRCCYFGAAGPLCATVTLAECGALGGFWDGSTTCEASPDFCDEFLPVEFGSLTAISGDGYVNLVWNTRSETDVTNFTVERTVESAWMPIGQIASLGNSSSGHSYSFRDDAVTNGTTYTYRVVAHNIDGSAVVNPNTASATPTHTEVISAFALEQNYPNPFNPSTTIKFDIAEAGFVKLAVYDLAGREVATLVNNTLSPNSYSVTFDGTNLSSGIYFYRLEAGNFTAIRKLTLMK